MVLVRLAKNVRMMVMLGVQVAMKVITLITMHGMKKYLKVRHLYSNEILVLDFFSFRFMDTEPALKMFASATTVLELLTPTVQTTTITFVLVVTKAMI